MQSTTLNHRFSVAPMLDWTDKHCRYFLRLMSKHTLLYTEMVTTGAIIHGKGDYLAYNKEEHPIALQLGGSNPEDMASCALLAQEYGYDEVNINVGCPSDRVKNGSFGACLMATPNVVAECVSKMQSRVKIPVTVKCRIGIDDMDEYHDLSEFIRIVADAGCNTFIVHARKAWLKGLSPKENRDIPPLNYDRVYALKKEYPSLTIAINGGITDLESAKQHLNNVDGVMIGREIYSNPYLLSKVDALIFNKPTTIKTREDLAHQMVDYTNQQVEQGARVWHVARHMLGLFQGEIGARIWRRYLSQHGTSRDTSAKLLLDALAEVQKAQYNAAEFIRTKKN